MVVPAQLNLALKERPTAKEGLPARTAFEEIDWSFPNRKTHSPIEGIHPYPAKFITELPSALLDVLPVPKGTVVLDPYCGSGTTLVEAQKRGLASVGVDLNPIACLISKVKTAPLPDNVDQLLDRVVRQAKGRVDSPIASIPNLDHWFLKPVQMALAGLTSVIEDLSTSDRPFFQLALSSIIVRVSNQESDTRYAAVPKSLAIGDVFDFFEASVQRTAKALAQRAYALSDATVLEADTLALQACHIGRPVGLVITSPPYPNAYEYWLYHKYRMWWLGHDPLAVKEREIGARAHFFRRDHHTADNFRHQMGDTFRLLKDVMVPGAYACFVVGRSKIHGEIIDNAAIVETAAEGHGFQRVFFANRVINPNRKSFNLSHANIKTESIVVLRLS